MIPRNHLTDAYAVIMFTISHRVLKVLHQVAGERILEAKQSRNDKNERTFGTGI